MSKKNYIEFARLFGDALRRGLTVEQFMGEVVRYFCCDNGRFKSEVFYAAVDKARKGGA